MIHEYENKKFIERPSVIDTSKIDISGSWGDVMRFFGYCREPLFSFGVSYPYDFEVYECSTEDMKYQFYGFISLCGSNFISDIVFKDQIQLLDFLKEYSSVFDLLRKNIMDQLKFDKEDYESA